MGPEAAKEEIRERADLVDLISQYVELRQAGRNWKGLCPFHQEKTPSFNVNRESRFWKCFGCGAGGDVFSFVQRIENLAFPEAMKFLADRVGVTWDPEPGFQRTRDEREEVLAVNDVAAHWFREQLAGQTGVAARAYLESRGLNAETIERFKVGFAPPKWDGLLAHLNGRGIGEERILRAALAKRSERGSIYDVFRNRIIFPICDVVGKVIAFGGRAMDPEDPAKYLNSPETLVFTKGRTFYGLDLARRSIGEAGHAVVVEGYMDVVALAQHGVDHCVATLGTALTEDHAKILSRYTSEIVLVYDDDEAGIQAALRSVKVFEDVPADVKVAPLKDGKDPDDYIRDFGTDAFRELLDQRIGLVEYRLQKIFDGHRDEGLDGRTTAAREAADVLAQIPDIARRQALVGWAADAWAGPDVARAASLEEALLREMQRRARDATPAKRDDWERVLAEKGIRHGRGSGPPTRRLPRSEWLEQQRQREQSLRAIDVTRLGGNRPDSPGSYVNTDFISENLSRLASPLVQIAQRRERLMLTAMLERSEIAALVLQMLRPAEMLLEIHRDIAMCVAEARSDESGAPNLVDALERLSTNEELFATAIDLATAEGSYEMDAVLEDVKLIREAKLLYGEGVPSYSADRKYQVGEEPIESASEGESLADLEQRVRTGLEEGTMTPDDPIYTRYMEIRRQLHGSGELPKWDFD